MIIIIIIIIFLLLFLLSILFRNISCSKMIELSIIVTKSGSSHVQSQNISCGHVKIAD